VEASRLFRTDANLRKVHFEENISAKYPEEVLFALMGHPWWGSLSTYFVANLGFDLI
jgi:hypothetical protein